MADSQSSIRIKVDLDDKGFDQGMKNTKKRLDDTGYSTKALKKDFKEFNDSLADAIGGFQKLGLFATGAIAGIAAASPALAGTMAKFKVEGLEFANTMGEALKPGLDTLLDGFSQLNDFLEGHPTITKMAGWALLGAAGLGTISFALTKLVAGFEAVAVAIGTVDAALVALGLGGVVEIGLVAAAAIGATYLFIKMTQALASFSNQFSAGISPPEDQGYKFAPGTRSIYDDAALGGSLKNQGLPSQTPERMYDPVTGEYRLKTYNDKTQDIINNMGKSMNLNLNLTLNNDGSNTQRFNRQMIVNPTFSG